jgi:hypothetical protein
LPFPITISTFRQVFVQDSPHAHRRRQRPFPNPIAADVRHRDGGKTKRVNRGMSNSGPDLTAYSTILFMDSMVALEGKPLQTQPWHEIDATGPILVLVVPQVNAEIDKRKRDGRLAKRAREFNRLIGPAAESGAPVRISDGPPIIDIAIAACDRIDWDALDDLDPSESDAKVVAQILHARGIPFERKLLFSQDINPIAMASRHALKCRKMPEHWLLEPEPSPNEKELMRLRGRVKELEAHEPDLNAVIAYGVNENVLLHRVRPLTNDEQHELLGRILVNNPKVRQESSASMTVMNHDSGYDDRYKKYRDVTAPRYVTTIHKRVATHYNQIPFSLSVANDGHIQAENLVVTLRGVGGTLHNRFVCPPLFQPRAPKPEPHRHSAIFQNHALDAIKRHLHKQVGRHDMEFAIGPNRSERIEFHCADFRHGRTWKFDGIALLDIDSGSPFKIEVEMTASNFRGNCRQAFELQYLTKDAAPGDLINLEGRGYLVEIPMATQYDMALAARETAWLQFVDDKEDDE